MFDATGGLPGYLLGTSEPDEQELLASHLKEGATFYDIGANIGFFVILAARLVGNRGRVIAFEPYPASITAIRRNVEMNGFQNVKIVQSAVLAQSGEATLQVAGLSGEHKVFKEICEGERVVAISIDDFVLQNSAPLPDFVMIDVEGGEIEVLKGMMDTIRLRRPPILVEVHWIGNQFFEFVKSQLIPLGYNVKPLKDHAFPITPQRFHALLEPNQPIH